MKHLTTGRITAVFATAATVFAIGGIQSSTAATLTGVTLPLPANSVGAEQIKDGSVGPNDLTFRFRSYLYMTDYRARHVTSPNITDGTIQLKDLSPELQELLAARCGKRTK